MCSYKHLCRTAEGHKRRLGTCTCLHRLAGGLLRQLIPRYCNKFSKVSSSLHVLNRIPQSWLVKISASNMRLVCLYSKYTWNVYFIPMYMCILCILYWMYTSNANSILCVHRYSLYPLYTCILCSMYVVYSIECIHQMQILFCACIDIPSIHCIHVYSVECMLYTLSILCMHVYSIGCIRKMYTVFNVYMYILLNV